MAVGIGRILKRRNGYAVVISFSMASLNTARILRKCIFRAFFEGAVCAIQNADLLIVAGTSLTVYPAAGLVNYYRGNRMVLINRDVTPYDSYANLVFHQSLGEIFSKL